MIVVDASAMVEALLIGEGAAARLAGEDLHAPHLLDAEVGDAVRGRLLGGQLAEAVAEAALATLAQLEVQRYAHVELLQRAWTLRGNLTIYEALYVALAELLDAPLVTTDARIASCPGLRVSVEVLPA